MSKLEFHPEQAIGEDLLQLDKQELLQFVSRLCLHIKSEVGSRAYRGGIFPQNICVNEEGEYAIGPARLEKWSGQELEFVAPELYWHGETGPASDVYSLALLVYYGLGEGKLPFETAAASGQLARMSGKALPAPKNAGKRLAEVLEKATAFRTTDRYRSPEELQIMLESCMDNKYLGGASGAETVFRKEDDQLSDIERMMVDIIERGEEEAAPAAEPEALPEDLSIEELAGLEKPEPVVQEPEDVHAMVEEFFGGTAPSAPEEPEEQEPENVRVYDPSREKKERQPIPILTEEKYPELAPVVLKQQPLYNRSKLAEEEPRDPEQVPEAEAETEQNLKKRRGLRPLAVVLCLCVGLVAGAFAVNLYWNRDVRSTQINPTPDPAKLLETGQPEAEQPEEADPQDPDSVVYSDEEQEPAQRYLVTVSDMSWTQAQAACWEQGGHLAVIRSQEELDEITALAEEQGITRLWIGCRRLNGNLVWENDEEVDFYRWGETEPSYQDSYDGVSEDFIMIYREGDQWFYNDNRNDPAADYPNFYSGTMGFVCEFEPENP